MSPAELHFPLSPGARWTYRLSWPQDDPSESSELTRRVLSVEEGGELPGLHWAPPGGEAGQAEFRPARGGALLQDTRGELTSRSLVEVAEGELLFCCSQWDELFEVRWRLPADLAPGARWLSSAVQMSCGYAVDTVEARCAAEEIEVPAGRFACLRVELGSQGDRLWLAPGVGLVRSEEQGRRLELLESTLLAS